MKVWIGDASESSPAGICRKMMEQDPNFYTHPRIAGDESKMTGADILHYIKTEKFPEK
jgi:hypothetical protein